MCLSVRISPIIIGRYKTLLDQNGFSGFYGKIGGEIGKLYRFPEPEGHPSVKGKVNLGKYSAYFVINPITFQPIQVYSSQIGFSNWSFDGVGLSWLDLGEVLCQKRFRNPQARILAPFFFGVGLLAWFFCAPLARRLSEISDRHEVVSV